MLSLYTECVHGFVLCNLICHSALQAFLECIMINQSFFLKNAILIQISKNDSPSIGNFSFHTILIVFSFKNKEYLYESFVIKSNHIEIYKYVFLSSRHVDCFLFVCEGGCSIKYKFINLTITATTRNPYFFLQNSFSLNLT